MRDTETICGDLEKTDGSFKKKRRRGKGGEECAVFA